MYTTSSLKSAIDIIKQIIPRLVSQLGILRHMNPTDRLYEVAVAYIGTDASPADEADDENGCMDSVAHIHRTAFPDIDFPNIVSTAIGLLYLAKSRHFREIFAPQKGCIMISATGTGNGKLIGHVGIVGKNLSEDGTLWIMSNNSYDKWENGQRVIFAGEWTPNYTVRSWEKRYNVIGGIKTRYFIPI